MVIMYEIRRQVRWEGIIINRGKKRAKKKDERYKEKKKVSNKEEDMHVWKARRDKEGINEKNVEEKKIKRGKE